MARSKSAAGPRLSPLSTECDPQPREMAGWAIGPDRQVRILSVSFAEEDHEALTRILREMPFVLTTTRTCDEAAAWLNREQFGIILCDRTLPDGNWIDILNQISGAPESPLLIVTSRLADEALWAEVLNLGGYDLLAKPFRQKEVQFVLTSAWVQRANPVRGTRVAGAA